LSVALAGKLVTPTPEEKVCGLSAVTRNGHLRSGPRPVKAIPALLSNIV
jgi:hypothetical protein